MRLVISSYKADWWTITTVILWAVLRDKDKVEAIYSRTQGAKGKRWLRNFAQGSDPLEHTVLRQLRQSTQEGAKAYEVKEEVIRVLSSGAIPMQGIEDPQTGHCNIPSGDLQAARIALNSRLGYVLQVARRCAPAYGHLLCERKAVLEEFPGREIPSFEARTEKRKLGRPAGSGAYDDDELLKEMSGLRESGEAKSINAAALAVADKAEGGGSIESKGKRLRDKYQQEINGGTNRLNLFFSI